MCPPDRARPGSPRLRESRRLRSARAAARRVVRAPRVDLVAMDERRAPTAACGEPFRDHRDDRLELRARQPDTASARAPTRRDRPRPSSRQAVSATICCASTSSGASCKRWRSSSPLPDRSEERGALDQVVARHGKHGPSACRGPSAPTGRPAEAGSRSVAASRSGRRIHMPDVDAQFQRRRGDERPQPARLQPRLRIEALLLREAAVMGGDRVFSNPVAEMSRQPLRHAPGVDKDERRLMGGDERRSRS